MSFNPIIDVKSYLGFRNEVLDQIAEMKTQRITTNEGNRTPEIRLTRMLEAFDNLGVAAYYNMDYFVAYFDKHKGGK